MELRHCHLCHPARILGFLLLSSVYFGTHTRRLLTPLRPCMGHDRQLFQLVAIESAPGFDEQAFVRKPISSHEYANMHKSSCGYNHMNRRELWRGHERNASDRLTGSSISPSNIIVSKCTHITTNCSSGDSFAMSDRNLGTESRFRGSTSIGFPFIPKYWIAWRRSSSIVGCIEPSSTTAPPMARTTCNSASALSLRG